MTAMLMEISLQTDQDRFYLNVYDDGKPASQDSMTLEEINFAEEIYLFHWLLNAGKKIFPRLPVPDLPEIKVTCDPEIWTKMSNAAHTFATALVNTNKFLNENLHLKDKAAGNKNILFYNEDNNDRFYSFFSRCTKMDPGHVLYRNMETGWDDNARRFDRSKVGIMSVYDLAKLIIGENIRKIVTVNAYYVDSVMGLYYINVITVLLFMGVELVLMDGDSYNDTSVGYINKASTSYNEFHRFSVFPYLDKSYDGKYNLKNIYYVPYPHDYEDVESSFEIEDDYSLVILSNARFPGVLTFIYPILYLLDFFDEKRIFTELELWWLSLRWMVLHDMDFNEVEQRHYESRLMQFFYSGCLSFLKYEIIDSIQTDRKVLIYGDPPWEQLFPGYYQKKYLSRQEKDKMFSEKRYLHLLMNFGYSYPEAHPTVNDALMRNVPFICHPHLVKTSPYSGFRHIEYNDTAELNSLIGDIGKSLNNAEFKASVRNYKELMRTSQIEMAENILFDKTLPADGGVYMRECEENNGMLNEMIQEHIKERGAFLKATFDTLFLKKHIQFDHTGTKFFGKNYVQKILAQKQKA